MSIRKRYEMAIHFRHITSISIKQSCFLQIRCGVGHGRKNKDGYEILNPTDSSMDETFEEGQILPDGSFLSPKIFFKPNTKEIDLNFTCIFKGELELSKSESDLDDLFVSCQLNWYQANESEVVSEWYGYLKTHIVSSALEIYFPSHLFTCHVEATVHCLHTSLIIDEDKANQTIKSKLFYNPITKKMSQLYDVVVDPLIASKRSLQQWMKEFSSKELEQITNDLKQIDPRQMKYHCLQGKFNIPKKNSITDDEIQILSKEIRKLSYAEYIKCIKDDSHEIFESTFADWKRFLNFLRSYPQSRYFVRLFSELKQNYQKQQWSSKIQILDEKNQIIENLHEKKDYLSIQNFEKNNCSVKISLNDFKLLTKQTQNTKKPKILILVHGFQASSFDMQLIAMHFKFRNPSLQILVSQNNEGRTEGLIQESGHRLAVEVKNFINSKGYEDMEINFIAHSLGGLIVRAALKYMPLFKKYFKTFISLCSPHFGYLHHTSQLVSTSLWVMNQLKKDPSLLELTLQDNTDLNKTYLFELSKRTQLSWFSNVILLASKQDQYVPFASAMMYNRQFFLETQSVKVYKLLHENVMKSINEKIMRIQIIYNQKVTDLSSFIGRTAHIKPLSYLPIIDLYTFLLSKKL